MYRTVLLDIDGVLQNFVHGAYRANGRLGEYVEGVTPDCWDFFKGWPLTATEFWEPITKEGPEFWTNLSLYPHAKSLIDLLTSGVYGDVIVATSPSSDPTSFAGKAMVIQQLFGKKFSFSLTNCKEKFGRPGWALIDDSDDNCAGFAERGGEAILFPANWNENRRYKDRAFEYVVDRLNDWKDLEDQVEIDSAFLWMSDLPPEPEEANKGAV